jgi:hypothetical protein
MRPARRRAPLLALLALLGALGPWARCEAGAFRYCEPPAELDASQQDLAFRFGAVIKSTLDTSGAALALVARSGLDLSRFGLRYSHAGISLRDSPNGPWSVRQLYFDCNERRPRLFDEGIAGFLVGSGDPNTRYFSVVLIPGAEDTLAPAVRENRLALRLVGATYSANAYAYGLRYQNCNQWVAEMLGVAWGGLADREDLRAEAQGWLQGQGYQPTRFEVGNPLLMWLGGVLPWLHRDDHPTQDIAEGRFRVSMPQSIEAFARARVPGARRIEFCHAGKRIVVREGWTPIAQGCVPEAGDRVIELEP